MFLKRLFILGFFSSLASLPTICQVKAPQITPLSPNAASLYKYTELPVNVFTGIPAISIPIYEIKSGNLSVPVSINYHAGGLKYEEQASWVGLGWTLHAGGAINRNVQGFADEKVGGILNQTNPLNQNIQECDYAALENVVKKYTDMAPDEFSYSTPSENGRFVFQAGAAQPVTIPYKPFKFNVTGSNGISKIEILDENGTTFRYGNYKNKNTPVVEATSGGDGIYVPDISTSTWLMTEIESADLANSITFNYSAGQNGVQKNSKYDHIDVLDMVVGDAAQGSPCTRPVASFGNALTQSLSYSTNTQYVSEILFRNGKIQFVQSTVNRTDIYDNQKSLEFIRIYATEATGYKLIKSYKFIYAYFQKYNNSQLQNWKLKLDKVQVLGSDEAVQEEYAFQYTTTTFSGSNNGNDINSQDYWGFYNGKANANLIPAQSIEYSPVGTTAMYYPVGGDRSVNPAYMAEGVLKRITYPTRGYTEFEFETHQYQELGQTKYAGGLRVKKIASYASQSAAPLVKTYKYGLANSGFGYKNFSNYIGVYSTQSNYDCMNSISVTGRTTYRVRTFNSMSSMGLDGYDGSPVIYPYVTEYMGDETINNGRTQYTYDNGTPLYDNYYLFYSPVTNLISRQSNDWNRGKLTSKIIYNASNKKVSEIAHSYQTIHPIDQVSGIIAMQRNFYPVEQPTGCYGDNSQSKYTHFYYPIRSGAVLPLTTTETIYDPSGAQQGTSNTTTFTFDPVYLQPVETQTTIKSTNSGYQELSSSFNKYPFNYSFTGAPSGSEALGIKLLQDKNISASPIEQYTVKKFKNPTTWQSDITAGTITTYRADKPYPEKVWQIETATPVTSASFGTGSSIISNAFSKNILYQEKLAFSGYDAVGNIMQYTNVSGLVNTYLWDYFNAYPVAEVTNADNNSIAFTSFEAENKGNWAYTGTPGTDATAPTGKKVYALNGSNTITKTGLSAGTTYTVSYWIQNTSPLTITGTQGAVIAGRILGSWRYYEHRIANQTLVSIAGSFPIDELRLYPLGALMTTYTYEPLIGLSGKCDPGNRISYYEYDKLGRMQLIRDQDRNIIKTQEYKYKTP